MLDEQAANGCTSHGYFGLHLAPTGVPDPAAVTVPNAMTPAATVLPPAKLNGVEQHALGQAAMPQMPLPAGANPADMDMYAATTDPNAQANVALYAYTQPHQIPTTSHLL